MKKTRSDFGVVVDLPDILAIEDLNCGRMSVTNDAEGVVSHLAPQLRGRRLIYRDSDGRWDELVHRDGVFTGFAPIGVRTLVDAVEKIRVAAHA